MELNCEHNSKLMLLNVKESRKDFNYALRAFRIAKVNHKVDELARTLQDQSPGEVLQNAKNGSKNLQLFGKKTLKPC